MTQTEDAPTLSQQLARRCLDRLVNEGLLKPELASAIEANFADGRMQDADWKLEFEKSLALQKRAEW
jgi:hypothetical protein